MTKKFDQLTEGLLGTLMGGAAGGALGHWGGGVLGKRKVMSTLKGLADKGAMPGATPAAQLAGKEAGRVHADITTNPARYDYHIKAGLDEPTTDPRRKIAQIPGQYRSTGTAIGAIGGAGLGHLATKDEDR